MATKKVNKKQPASAERQDNVNPSQSNPPSLDEISDHGKLIVVGIGASAGGLHALQSFFDSLADETGLAFVVVTHMHPEHESHLAELLQTHTPMRVIQIQESMPLQANHVYVMPPNRQVLVSDSHLDLGDFEEPGGRRAPIDSFFRSLAAAHHNSIGVILSGSGTDGSVGIKDIKENGGLILVQSPEQAEYDGMPRAAITTGLADLVLPLEQLAERLVEYAHRPSLPHNPEHLTNMQEVTINRILAHVHARTGNDFGQYKRSTILRRIQRRMHLNGFPTLEAYLEFLHKHGDEATAIFNDILIGVTNFFRDRESWNALEEKVIQDLFKNKESDSPIRVWSIGCASGEEAYCLGILMLEGAATRDKHPNIQVFASDMAETSLVYAREGQYPSAIEADVSAERLERFFTREGDHYRVKKELRDIVLFTNHNLLRDPPFSHIDLVVCRNLLIYLRREVQDNIFEIFHYSLNPGGYLFLGTSESADSASLFQAVDKVHRIYRARPWHDAQPHLPSMPQAVGKSRKQDQPASHQPLTRKLPKEAGEALEIHESTLEEAAPPSVIIDDQYNILHVSETAGRFLVQRMGVPGRELLKLIRPELQAELQTTLFQCFEHGQSVVSHPVWVRFNGDTHRVLVYARPVQGTGKGNGRHALVLFIEDEIAKSAEPAETPNLSPELEADPRVGRLQAEVRHLREQLQAMMEEHNSSNEEMKTANEELQSINEEYRSTAEELETSREELQSVNEELQTVNNELKSKLEESSRTNSDLENLMTASELATLFLSRDLRIKRFTAGMDQALDLMASDLGRPVAHFANKLGYDNLVTDAESVLRRLVNLERELQTMQGRWFLVRMRPYRTMDDKIDGVVITFVDITELKKAQHELMHMNDTLQQRVRERTEELAKTNRGLIAMNEIFTTMFQFNPIPTALHRLKDWTFLNVNKTYADYFSLRPEDIIGKTAIEFGFAPDATRRAEMRRTLEETGQISRMELTFHLPSGERRTVLGSMQRFELEGEPQVISSFIDITDRVKAEQQIRSLASDLTMAEQRERQRISQVLHDELQQRLFALRMQLTFLREAYENNEMDTYKVDLPQIEKRVAEAIEVTRSLSMELSPMILKGEGLVQAIAWLGNQMDAEFGLKVNLQAPDGEIPLSDTLRMVLYQAVHELLFNIVKHAGVKEADVEVHTGDNRLRITVRDQGIGFDTRTLKAHTAGTHGLMNTQNRLTLLGCSMEIRSSPGNGTEVIIETPILQAEE